MIVTFSKATVTKLGGLLIHAKMQMGMLFDVLTIYGKFVLDYALQFP